MVETIAYIKEVKAKGIQDLSLRIKVNDSYFILYLSPGLYKYRIHFGVERLSTDHSVCMNILYPQRWFTHKQEVLHTFHHMPFLEKQAALLTPHSLVFCMLLRKCSF